ncbi:unnamed protein product [Microthlaspi erraticum]|uniref:Uncharacterized protein n=1 Tax=Microthlaspi erraticum TaxID=1685480 RepID=A0A6D2IYM3_9BRAS|nr:unnamed protein product [Microthlaspi erraticum]
METRGRTATKLPEQIQSTLLDLDETREHPQSRNGTRPSPRKRTSVPNLSLKIPFRSSPTLKDAFLRAENYIPRARHPAATVRPKILGSG